MDVGTLAVVVIGGSLAFLGVWYLVRAAARRQQGNPETNQIPASPTSSGTDPTAAGSHRHETPALALVRAWAKDRACASCGHALGEQKMSGHHLALLEPNGITRDWVEIAVDRLPLALSASSPVCWNCHVALTFRRLHPELVTDRDAGAVHVDTHS